MLWLPPARLSRLKRSYLFRSFSHVLYERIHDKVDWNARFDIAINFIPKPVEGKFLHAIQACSVQIYFSAMQCGLTIYLKKQELSEKIYFVVLAYILSWFELVFLLDFKYRELIGCFNWRSPVFNVIGIIGAVAEYVRYREYLYKTHGSALVVLK